MVLLIDKDALQGTIDFTTMPNPRKKRAFAAASAASRPLSNRLRIVGGRWRSVPITFPSLPAVRPSPDRVRETLFNWLQPVIAGARCLDLFAGSGALGIEALSRGAERVTFVDCDARIGKHLFDTLHRLGVEQPNIIVADATSFLDSMPQHFDVVFLDPPYTSNVLPRVCENLVTRGWLAAKAFVYLECAATSPLPVLPAHWTLHRSKRAGKVGYHLLHTLQRSEA